MSEKLRPLKNATIETMLHKKGIAPIFVDTTHGIQNYLQGTMCRRVVPREIKIHEPQTGSNIAKDFQAWVWHKASHTVRIPLRVWTLCPLFKRMSYLKVFMPTSSKARDTACFPQKISTRSYGPSILVCRIFLPQTKGNTAIWKWKNIWGSEVSSKTKRYLHWTLKSSGLLGCWATDIVIPNGSSLHQG